MEKFQVYNRELQTWNDENISAISGWNTNFVQDKTTDSGKIKIKYKGNTAPNWRDGDWCRFLHLVGNETGATYTKKTETINRSRDYIVSQLVRLEYDERTTELTVYFDEKMGDHSCDIYVKVYANTSNGKQTYLLTAPYFDGKEYHTFTLNEEFSGFLEYLEAQTEITSSLDIITIEDSETTEYYLPLNHEQYIIANPTMVYDKVNDEWDIQLDLYEPTEIANGIVFETRSFTNQIEKTIDNVVYTHEAKNHLNVLESLLATTPANNDIQKSWYSRIKITDKEWLQNQAFNDDTYSEASLYDVLLNKYDSNLGRTPALLFDVDGETDLPYNNDRTEYVLQFLRQDGFDKDEIQMSDLVQGAGQTLKSSSWENKADGIVSNVDNLSTTTTTRYVSEYLWAVPEVDTTERDISGYNDENSNIGIWILRTPHLIKNIKSVDKLQVIVSYSYPNTRDLTRAKTNETRRIYEKKQYEASDDVFNTRNAIWYEEGTNIIHLNDFYYKDNRVYLYRVEYEPLISFRYDDGADYRTIINQTDGQVGETRYSKYIQDYLNSMNKTDITISKTVENWADIKELGSRVIDGDKVYLITAVAVSNRDFDYDVVYQLNENHFRKNDSIVAPQNIRKNIEIGYNGLTDRKSCLIEKYNISFTNNNQNISNRDRRYLFGALLSDNSSSITGRPVEKPQLAKLRLYSINTKQNGDKVLRTYDRLCNGAITVINDTICFNLRYQDNAECGKQKVLTVYRPSLELIGVDTSPERQIPILYTDGFGEIKNFDVSLINFYVEELSNYAGRLTEEEATKTNRYLNVTTNYPLTTGINELTTSYAYTIKGINYDKDMLDIFNYTIGFKIEGDKNMILCRNFFLNSALIGGIDLAYISAYDRNVQENEITLQNGVSVTSILSGNQIYVNATTRLADYKSIVLWDTNQKPVLIINDADKLTSEQFNGQSLKLYC